MAGSEAIAYIDSEISRLQAEIAKLQQARELLGGAAVKATSKAGRGRPKGSKNIAAVAPGKRKRNLSPEGRKAIAEAMKRRWAERRAKAEK